MSHRLACVSCHYNYAGFKRPRQNLRRFLRQVRRDGAPCFGVELCRPGQDPATADNPSWRHFTIDPDKHMLWQKEALLNLAEELVPEDYTAVAWIDADVWFDNPNWVSEAERALTEHDVIQLFETSHWTTEDGSVEKSYPSAVIVGLDDTWQGHPGFAWAMTRDYWRRIRGLFDRAITGCNDTVMHLAFANKPLWAALEAQFGLTDTRFKEWRARVGTPRMGWIAGDCYHEWHGTREDRKYWERTQLVSSVDTDRDLTLSPDGFLEWMPHVERPIIEAIKRHFMERNEDGC